MSRRIDLQNLLESILGSDKVYFQPPATIQMSYPCIVYTRTNINTDFADNNPYGVYTQYQITVIDKNPDSPIPMKIAILQRCSYDRHYSFENLNHDVFNLYY
jgi:hypothetical protein